MTSAIWKPNKIYGERVYLVGYATVFPESSYPDMTLEVKAGVWFYDIRKDGKWVGEEPLPQELTTQDERLHYIETVFAMTC